MKPESTVDTLIALEHPKATGGFLWRNNVGALPDARGIPVRYGLANDSKSMNDHIKSADRIGITPVLITAEMVGQVVGVFTAVEVKGEGWTPPNPTNVKEYKHYLAQARFIELVSQAGGFAGFATCVLDYLKIIRRQP